MLLNFLLLLEEDAVMRLKIGGFNRQKLHNQESPVVPGFRFLVSDHVNRDGRACFVSCEWKAGTVRV